MVVLLSHTGAFLESTSRKRPTNFTFYPLGPLPLTFLTLDEMTIDGALQGGPTGLGFRLRTDIELFHINLEKIFLSQIVLSNHKVVLFKGRHQYNSRVATWTKGPDPVGPPVIYDIGVGGRVR